jgi:hypothetical protein
MDEAGVDLDRRSTGLSQTPPQSPLIVVPQLGGPSGSAAPGIATAGHGPSRRPLGVDPPFGGDPLEDAGQFPAVGFNEFQMNHGRVSTNAVGEAKNREYAVSGHPPLEPIDTGAKRAHRNAHRSQDRDTQAETDQR